MNIKLFHCSQTSGYRHTILVFEKPLIVESVVDVLVLPESHNVAVQQGLAAGCAIGLGSWLCNRAEQRAVQQGMAAGCATGLGSGLCNMAWQLPVQ